MNGGRLAASGLIAALIGVPILALGLDSENANRTPAILIGGGLVVVGVSLTLWGIISSLRQRKQ